MRFSWATFVLHCKFFQYYILYINSAAKNVTSYRQDIFGKWKEICNYSTFCPKLNRANARQLWLLKSGAPTLK